LYEVAEKRFQQLQKVVGRIEKVLTPVEDEEVAHIVRRRLFKYVDERLAEETIQEFIDYAEREDFLPIDKVIYREKFKSKLSLSARSYRCLIQTLGLFHNLSKGQGEY